MKAFIIDRYKSKDGGRIAEMPEPELLEDDVLVRVRAAGINLLDSKIRGGEFKLICLIAYRSFWAMMWPASWSKSDLECGDSSAATRYMLGQQLLRRKIH
jgi:hypothetical protein